MDTRRPPKPEMPFESVLHTLRVQHISQEEIMKNVVPAVIGVLVAAALVFVVGPALGWW